MQQKQLLTKWLNNASINMEFHEKIDHFLSFLLEKNMELNVISRKLDTETIISEHIYDCLDAHQHFANAGSIVDLGSGGGFPGILLAIIFPDKEITLIEKSAKKSDYLGSVKNHLQLDNVRILNQLVTDVKLDTDIVTCRAFKKIHEIINMTVNIKASKYILYKGRKETISEEIENLKKKDKYNIEIHPVAKLIDKERHIVHMTTK